MTMKRTLNYGWGQRIISPQRNYSDSTLRKILIKSHQSGNDIIDTINGMSPKNGTRAWELYNECPVLEEKLRA